jgi:molybdate transport system ATP-binding protein
MTLSVALTAEAPVPLEVAFSVAPGELLGLVGPSGAGKTTILRGIAGLWRPRTGRVAVEGETWLDTAAGIALPAHRRHVGVVFQGYALFPHMTAVQNVLAAMDRPDPAEAARLLDLVNLHGLSDRKPAQLSGGQQQRVALARALARKPAALLLDEPFSAVDRATRERLHAEILALRAHLGMPIVLVTHDLSEAQLLADRMAVIEKGRLVREGTTAEVMSDPEALRTLGIRELGSLLPARIAGDTGDGLMRLDTAAGPMFLPRIEAEPGAQVQVRIMAHDVILSRGRPEGLSAQNILPGRVVEITSGAGPGAIVHLRIGESDVVARITRRALNQLGLKPGDEVHAIVKAMSVARDRVVRGRRPG